jgi:hypothetical protein
MKNKVMSILAIAALFSFASCGKEQDVGDAQTGESVVTIKHTGEISTPTAADQTGDSVATKETTEETKSEPAK